MVYFPILKAAVVVAFASIVIAVPAKKDFDDLLLYVTLPPTQAQPITPEWITVPADFIPPVETENVTASRGFQPPIEERAIINGESRFLYEGTEYPFRTVGRVTWNIPSGGGVICSGTLVGPRHVLTAHHCVGDGTWTNGRFAPSFDNGERFGSAGVVGVITDPNFNSYPDLSPCWLKNDYAIMILDRPIGNDVGYMFLLDVPNPDFFNQPILNSCGYPGDKGASQPWCQYRGTPSGYGGCDNTGPVWTDLDAISGQSGSPVWQQRVDGSLWLWGVISAVTASTTIVASGDTMLLGLKFARAGWP